MGFKEDIAELKKISDGDEQGMVIFWFGRAAMGEFERIIKELTKIELSPPKTPVQLPDPNFYESCVHMALDARGQVSRLIEGINLYCEEMKSRYQSQSNVSDPVQAYLSQLQEKFSALIKFALKVLEFSRGRDDK
jgi:hypothetical protein